VLFVHGMHGGSWYLRSWLYAAAHAGWDAWAVNLRGHHGSRPVRDLGAVSVLDYVDDVEDCLRELREAVVIGHSMGGLVAQKVAGNGRVRAAVFATTAAPKVAPKPAAKAGGKAIFPVQPIDRTSFGEDFLYGPGTLTRWFTVGGLLLVVAFSLGLAGVLTGIGIGTLVSTLANSANQTQLISFFVNPPLALRLLSRFPVFQHLPAPAWSD